MNQEAIHYIMQRMSGWLDNRQMIVLQNTLDESVKMTADRETEKITAELLDVFIATKRLRISFAGPWQLRRSTKEYRLNRCSGCWATRKSILRCIMP